MSERLDAALVRLGLSGTLAAAEAELRAGNVLVDEVGVDKPGARVRPGAVIRLRVAPSRYVSRGGLKLEAALDGFGVDPTGRICVDLGASTGGFTDCLLQRGAARVYAVDVGYGQLAWSLRQDPRVVVMERTNARNLQGLPEQASLLVGDLSFISLRTVLPTIRRLVTAGGEAVLLVKPQFEVGRRALAAGGLVQDERARAEALGAVAEAATSAGFTVRGERESPITGSRAGNREWLLHLG